MDGIIALNKAKKYVEEYVDSNGGGGITITSQSVTYQASSSGTTTPTGTWLATVPTVTKGQFLWTKTVVTYSDATVITSYAVGYMGTNGTNGTNGTTPVRGTDYWTMADIDEIKAYCATYIDNLVGGA